MEIVVKKRIVIVSDCSDVAYNEMYATIISLLDQHGVDDVVVEPLIKAKEFSLINGSFLVRLMADVYNPKNTIFLGVLNALSAKRKERARIVVELNNGLKLVGANTGLFNWLIDDFGLKSLYEVEKKGLKGKEFISFGGKYVHSPVAARVAMGISFDLLGEKKEKEFLSQFDILPGTVLHIDNFGVPKVKLSMPAFKEGDQVEVFVNGVKKVDAVMTSCMKDLPTGSWAIFPGSSLHNLVEIALVRQVDSAKALGVDIGDKITLQKVD